jgi:ornithine lipid ester-linked acyl 2-hydroxylase
MVTKTAALRAPATKARDLARPLVEAPIARLSLVGRGNFLGNDAFPWTAVLERGFDDIRAELDTVLASGSAIPSFQQVLPSQRSLTSDDRWRTFMLYGYGHRIDSNCRRCPRTDALLQRIPGMRTAFFSILSPGKHIPPHRGFYNGVLRYHLGLIVPDDWRSCWIRVGDEVHRWREGEGVVFDDTHEHEVRNDTDQQRVVLFVDFLRPLPFPASTFNSLVVKAISQLPEIRRAARSQRPPG